MPAIADDDNDDKDNKSDSLQIPRFKIGGAPEGKTVDI